MNHIELAKKYFEEKYHCSQAVLAAFAEELGLTEEQALKFGGVLAVVCVKAKCAVLVREH